MKLTYRSALPEDAAECVAVRGRTRENAFSEEQLRSIGITAKSWGENIRTGALPGHVCIADDRIVGYCFGSRDSGEIEVLVVLPDFENVGIGRDTSSLMMMVTPRIIIQEEEEARQINAGN